MTEQQQYVLSAAGVFKAALEVLNERSLKYTGDHSPFANFESGARVADTDVMAGIMTRFGDKLGRIQAGLRAIRADEDPNLHADESLKDSILDAVNFLTILLVYIETNGGEDFRPFLEEYGMVPPEEKQPVLPGISDEPTPTQGWWDKFIATANAAK